ncbi:DUF2510 domain-containing protein [Nocardioides sp.]|uniref:DUF2510 domain-containing protein n=1 Tax=Nocardioides sp. TaxID=35761 RepID=UPI0039E6A7C0
MAETIPPGWYDDGSGAQRWWDGLGWTEHTAPEPPILPDHHSAAPASGPGRRRVLVLGVLAVAGCVAVAGVVVATSRSGHGSSSGAAKAATTSVAVPTPTPTVEDTSTPTPTPTPTPSPGPAHSASWDYANEAGYSYRLTISLYDPVDGGLSGGHQIGEACDFDPAADIAIPGVMEAVATTAGFATDLRASFIIEHIAGDYTGAGVMPSKDDDRVRVEQYFSDGSECREYSSTNIWGYGAPSAASVHWENPVEEGGRVSHRFTVIVKDYLTPRTPEGDAALLDWITIRPMATTGGEMGDADTYLDVAGTDLYRSERGLTLSGEQVGPS